MRKPTGVPRNCIASTAKSCAGRDPFVHLRKLAFQVRADAVTAACARSSRRARPQPASTLKVGLPRSFNVGSVSALTGTVRARRHEAGDRSVALRQNANAS